MVTYKISVIPGDGIGPEVIAEGIKVIDAASEACNFEVEWVKYPFSADYYLATGELLSEESLKELEKYKAIYMGAVGDPRVPPGILEKGILLNLRFYFDEYINLRPIQLFEGVPTPLAGKSPKDVNFDVIRENTEDLYVSLGGRVKKKAKEELNLYRRIYSVKFELDIESDLDEVAYQLMVISRKGAERVIKYAFELAKKKKKNKVTSVDKANVLTYAYGLWREVLNEVKKDYPNIEVEYAYVDAAAMWFVKNPEAFQIVVTPNMFGDILTDLGAIIQGGLGMAAGANINPEGTSMFEPIHGSAPKYKGLNKANPIATILAGKLMLEFLGEEEAANLIEEATKEVLKGGKVKPVDLGGSAKTFEVGNAIASKMKELSEEI
ncbi:isocitrate/isopropylmalate dehydrogenase family protein [Candidatus Bathyarchaeota archaeon]|nr:isocitrate/isopropylmalate dehydrogenase family protein [Candidatus Bathyarchaeota archaeon]